MSIDIVTAFFDMGRDGWSGFERGNARYIEYFRFWARLRNRVVVYTSPEFAPRVEAIRDAFGLADRTTVVAVPDVHALDADMYRRIDAAMGQDIGLNFHKDIRRPESWSAKYNYFMAMKSYFIVDAIEKGLVDGTVAWMDFGFNHGGGGGLIDATEFDFEWRHDFAPKVHLFLAEDMDAERPIFDIVRTMDVYVQGNVIVAPAALWPEFRRLTREAMLSLTRCGLCDDDQTLAVMAWRERPDLFELHRVQHWYDAVKCFGGEHLSVAASEPRRSRLYRSNKYRARIFLAEGRYRLAWRQIANYFRKRP